MVIFIVNGYAHRLLNSGIMESAPVRMFGLPSDKEKQVIVPEDQWANRTPQSMNLSGGDISLIESELSRLTHIFQDESYRLPSSMPLSSEVPLATAPR